MLHKSKKWVALGVLLLGLGCGGSGGDGSEETMVPVEVAEIGEGQVRQTLTYNGDIAAELDVKVFSKVPDRIERYFIDEGESVRRGDPIAKIVSTTIEQAVLQAEAGLSAARAQSINLKSEFERAQRLHGENAISKQQYDGIKAQHEAAVAQLQQAEAVLATAESQLNDATLTSPINGLVGKRYLEAGDMASPAMPVASVVQMDRVKIKFDATEEDLGRLTVGQKADIRVRSYPESLFEGNIVKISPILDPMTRMASIEVLIPNPKHRLKPGMFAEIEITTGILENALVVPRYAVLENTTLEGEGGDSRVVKNYFVYVVNDSSRAEQRKLEVDYVNHIQIAVQSGVEIGEKLVISGQKNLREGMLVLIPGDVTEADGDTADVQSGSGEEGE